MKKAILGGLLLAFCSTAFAHEVKRYPLPNNSTFPIAQAVEISGDATIIYHSGTVPSPADPDAPRGSREFWGDTEAQSHSVFQKMQASLEKLGLDFGDVVKMTVFLVPDPANDNRMDFRGFMNAYTQYFGTEEQPNLPARSAVAVAGLAGQGMLVEVEVVLVRNGD